MKKIIALLICVCMVLAFVACDSKSTSTETLTYNGITRTTVTTTTNGTETVEVTYTDADGKTMDAEAGAAAFEAAQAAVEGTMAEIEDSISEAEEAIDEEAESFDAAETEVTKEAGARTVEKAATAETYEAVLTIVNDMDQDITDINISYSEDTSWGDNLLEDYDGLEAGYQIKFGNHIFYTTEDSFDMRVIYADGTSNTFSGFNLIVDDPESVTITIGIDSDGDVSLFFK